MSKFTTQNPSFRDPDGKCSSITLLGYLKNSYKNIVNPLCSWREFRNYFFSNYQYESIYMKWFNKHFKVEYEPTIKLKDESAGYKIDNIIWLTKQKLLNSNKSNEKVNKIRQEQWNNISRNPNLMKYYQWNGSLSVYKLTRNDWNNLVLASNGHCMLNGEQFKNAGRDCHIDHDHNTGKVRGLLCARCNHLLAGVDNNDFKQKAERYLTTDTRTF